MKYYLIVDDEYIGTYDTLEDALSIAIDEDITSVMLIKGVEATSINITEHH